METHSVGAELFHAEGRTEMTEPVVAFRNFADTATDPPIFSGF